MIRALLYTQLRRYTVTRPTDQEAAECSGTSRVNRKGALGLALVGTWTAPLNNDRAHVFADGVWAQSREEGEGQ